MGSGPPSHPSCPSTASAMVRTCTSASPTPTAPTSPTTRAPPRPHAGPDGLHRAEPGLLPASGASSLELRLRQLRDPEPGGRHPHLPSSGARSAGAGARLQLEYRPADATASPYMVVGALIQAGLSGVRRGLPLPPECHVDPGELTEARRRELGIVSLRCV